MTAGAEVEQRGFAVFVRPDLARTVRTAQGQGRTAQGPAGRIDHGEGERARRGLGSQRGGEEDVGGKDESGDAGPRPAGEGDQARRSTYRGRRRPPSWVGAKSAAM